MCSSGGVRKMSERDNKGRSNAQEGQLVRDHVRKMIMQLADKQRQQHTDAGAKSRRTKMKGEKDTS